MSTKEFVEKAKNKHDDRYSYEETIYVNSSAKVNIKCNHCGLIFSQTANKHLIGRGCPECGKNIKGKNTFIKEAISIHGDKYSYSKVKYTRTDEKVTITCPIHGDFEQTPHGHLKGYGCYQCGRESLGNKTRHNEEYYITKAKKVHGDKFDYSKLNYIALNKPVTITCPIHGEFTQRADGHLKYGCEKCSVEKQIMTTDEFINKAKLIHGNLYSYDKTSYVSYGINVIITCKKHGDFIQNPNEHIRGSGCPICNSSKGEKKIYNFLKRNKIIFKKEYKLPNYNYRYDFYLPELNMLIEYDGVQHIRPVEFFGGINAFKQIKENDTNKNILAKAHKLPLIRIPYTELNRLEKYLLNQIKKHIKYKRDNKYFKNFLEFAKFYNLPGDATPEQYEKYLLTFN
jgi:very-short-patch-repair endonuclease/phage FluMu protein Com